MGEGYRHIEARSSSFRPIGDVQRVVIRSTRGGRSKGEGLRTVAGRWFSRMGRGDHLRTQILQLTAIKMLWANDGRVVRSRLAAHHRQGKICFSWGEPFRSSRPEAGSFVGLVFMLHAVKSSAARAIKTSEPRRRSGREIAAPAMGYRLSFPSGSIKPRRDLRGNGDRFLLAVFCQTG